MAAQLSAAKQLHAKQCNSTGFTSLWFTKKSLGVSRGFFM